MRSSILPRRALSLAAAAFISLGAVALPGVASADDEPSSSSPVVDSAASPGAQVVNEESSTQGSESTDGDRDPGDVAAAAPAPVQFFSTTGIDGGISFMVDAGNPGPSAPTSFEVSTDDGATWVVPSNVTQADNGYLYGDVRGLVNGTTYTVSVRGVNASGTGGASPSQPATAYRPIGAPTGAQVFRTATTITVSWTGAGAPGTYPQQSFAVGWAGSESGGLLCETAPSGRSCSVPVPSTGDFTVAVAAVDTENNVGDETEVASPVSAVQPAPTTPVVPAAVPTKDDGDLVGPSGPISSVSAGQQVVLQGAGYLAGSTVRLSFFSSPVDLGTAVVASDGTFSTTVTLPAGLESGTHHLVATGYAPDGSARNLVITVTVAGGSATVVATLATTGFDAVPVAVGGALVLLVGGGLLVGARRRTTV